MIPIYFVRSWAFAMQPRYIESDRSRFETRVKLRLGNRWPLANAAPVPPPQSAGSVTAWLLSVDRSGIKALYQPLRATMIDRPEG